MEKINSSRIIRSYVASNHVSHSILKILYNIWGIANGIMRICAPTNKPAIVALRDHPPNNSKILLLAVDDLLIEFPRATSHTWRSCDFRRSVEASIASSSSPQRY